LGLLGYKGNLYAYEYNALYPIVLDKVQDPLTIDENETVIAGTVYSDTDSLMFYTKSGKVIEYKDNRMSFVDTADGSFKKGVAVQAYGNKLYLLDPDGNQIWRYTRRRDKFDAAEAWNVNADLKNGITMAIDGNIYVLNKDGFITKMFSGNKEDFPVKKQPVKALKNPTKIYTELDMSQIYILEPSEKRVLIYYKDDKTGGATYSSQYIFDDLTDLRDLYVDKDTNKMYLMDATKVYTVAL
jgi:sugar lactone lactonase YvrE